MKLAYIAMGEKDTIEGKGGMKPIGAFWDKKLAEEVSAKQGGCMGRPQKPWVNEMPIFDSLEDREEYEKDELRRKALAKLTDNEKILLGLVDNILTK